MKTKFQLFLVVILMVMCFTAKSQPLLVKPDTLSFKSFGWKSEVPSGSPFRLSKELTGIKFLGVKSGFHVADTWYPTWADDNNLYSPFTDGQCPRLDGSFETSNSAGENATTGQAVIEGDNPLTL